MKLQTTRETHAHKCDVSNSNLSKVV